MRTLNTAFGVLAAVGIYFAWRNRFQIQRFLESQGIDTKIDTSNVMDTLKSAGSKVAGKVDHELNKESSSVSGSRVRTA